MTKSYAMETRDRLVEAGNFADADTNVDDVVQIIEDDEREINRLKAENAEMREALLIIAGGKDARGNYEEVAWHMAQLAAEAIEEMSDCFSCIHFGKCSHDPTYCHSWDTTVAEGGAK